VATPVASQVVSVHRFSVEDVMAMVEAGILDDDDVRMELVDGVLVEMSPPGPLHSGVVAWLNKQLVIAAGDRFSVRVQDVFLTGEYGFRSPDLSVIEPIGRDRLPDTAVLVVEVAYSSRARDLGKASDYAAAGVCEYWIVDVDRNEVLVHREPGDMSYASVERFVAGDAISPLVDIPPIDVAALLAR
jgi:Uma2 family endonuclease